MFIPYIFFYLSLYPPLRRRLLVAHYKNKTTLYTPFLRNTPTHVYYIDYMWVNFQIPVSIFLNKENCVK